MIVFWILRIILTVVLALLALVIAVLGVPVALRIRSAPGRNVRAEVVWLFGAVRVRLDNRLPWRRSSADNTQKRREKRARKKQDRDATRERGRRHIPPGGVGDIVSLARPMIATVGEVIHRFRVSGEGDLFVGFADPADTGRLWGQGYPLVSRIAAATGIGIHPAFEGATVRLEGAVAIRTVPITLTFPVLRFLVSRDGRRLRQLIRRSR